LLAEFGLEVGAAIGIGFVFGFVITLVINRVKNHGKSMEVTLGSLIVVLGLSIVIHSSNYWSFTSQMDHTLSWRGRWKS